VHLIEGVANDDEMRFVLVQPGKGLIPGFRTNRLDICRQSGRQLPDYRRRGCYENPITVQSHGLAAARYLPYTTYDETVKLYATALKRACSNLKETDLYWRLSARMLMSGFPFGTTDWSVIEPTEHHGDSGSARWRTRHFGDIRVRMVEYSPGYIANHWCTKGHILLCLEGELHTQLADGRTFVLTPGTTYQVSDDQEPHRSSTRTGAKLFIVD
jgi:hypothetical protein